MKKTLQNTINTINAVIELINGKYQVIYKNGTTKTYSKKPSYFNDYVYESWSKLIDNGTIYAYSLEWLKANYPDETIKIEEVEEVQTQTIETSEEDTDILSVNEIKEKDWCINEEGIRTTKDTYKFTVNYINGKKEIYTDYNSLPEEVKQFIKKRKYNYSSGEFKKSGDDFWHIEYEYININPKTSDTEEVETITHIVRDTIDNQVVAISEMKNSNYNFKVHMFDKTLEDFKIYNVFHLTQQQQIFLGICKKKGYSVNYGDETYYSM